jgi:hypothetical protein
MGYRNMVYAQQLKRAAWVGGSLISGFALWSAMALPSRAAQNGESLRPTCVGKGNGKSACVYSLSNPAPGTYKYYEGTISNGIPNGEGIFIYPNDDRYEGGVLHGLPSGRGMFLFSNNDRYEGSITQGVPSGYGTFTLASGDRYTGNVKEGHPHGNGTFTFSNGNVYTGEFYLGQVRGQGVFTAGGVRCTGTFYSSQLTGKGTCSFPTGASYRSYNGEFRRGRADGRGSAVFSDGTQFTGEFRQGRPFIPNEKK